MTVTHPGPARPIRPDRPTRTARTPGTGVRTGLRATTASAVLVAWRRSRADLGLLALSALLLAATVALCLLAPGIALRSADHALRTTVAAAGDDADVVVQRAQAGGQRTTTTDTDPNAASELREAAADIRAQVPATLRGALGAAVSSFSTRSAVASTATSGTHHVISTRLVYTTGADAGPAVRWVAGRAPVAAPATPHPNTGPGTPEAADDDTPPPPHVVQVGLAQGAARDLGITPGTLLDLHVQSRGDVEVLVSGLYVPVDATAPAWTQFPDLLAASPSAPDSGTQGQVALLLTDASLPDAQLWIDGRAVTVQHRYAVRTDALSSGATRTIERDVRRIVASPQLLQPGMLDPATVLTSLGSILETQDVRQAAAAAQESVLEVGLAGVGALCLVLAARLLVARRSTFLLAERARGASTASVALRALVESVPLVAVATLVGALVAWLVMPDGPGLTSVALLVAGVAALAPAVSAAALVQRAWSGRRLPANRADRQRVLGRRRARRVTLELTLVVVAVAALVSVQRRGLLESATDGVDVLLAATPLLLAGAATVVVLHLLPPVLRGLSRRAAARRGLVPVVATARASRTSGTAVPLLTLTVAVALLVFCGTTVVSARAGQQAAADVVVGADVRVDGAATDQDVERLRAQPGVTAVAGAALMRARSLGGSSGLTADVALVDVGPLATILRAHGRPVDAGLPGLAHASGTPVPILVSPSLVAATGRITPQLLTGGGTVTLGVAGIAADPPRLTPVVPRADQVDRRIDGTVVADRATFERAMQAGQRAQSAQTSWTNGATVTAPDLTTVWVDGPGAAAAVHAVGLDRRDGIVVTGRTTWLDATRTSPLNEALVALLVGTGLALAAFAAMALVLTVVATSGERGRTLSALRTLGLDARTARALTAGELAPLVVAALVAGSLIGVGVPWLLTRSLGLDVVSGLPGTVTFAVSGVPFAVAVVVLVGALLAAVAVESVVRRRDRLGEVLRVGER